MIEAKAITFSYGKREVLRGADLIGLPGECVAILGMNGCGKSTLLRILAGASRPDSGSLTFDGQDMLAHKKLFSQYVGYVPQDNPLIGELSVMDNLRLWYGSRRAVEEALASGFLSVLGLSELLSMRCDRLSGGQKKRVNLGCAAAGDPPVLVMDEPCASLDLVCQDQIRRYLRLYLEHRGIILLATHDYDDLELCSRAYVMRSGILTQVDPGLRGERLLSMMVDY